MSCQIVVLHLFTRPAFVCLFAAKATKLELVSCMAACSRRYSNIVYSRSGSSRRSSWGGRCNLSIFDCQHEDGLTIWAGDLAVVVPVCEVVQVQNPSAVTIDTQDMNHGPHSFNFIEMQVSRGHGSDVCLPKSKRSREVLRNPHNSKTSRSTSPALTSDDHDNK